MKVKVSEATGPVLDWMVDSALGGYNPGTLYSSYWAEGGPIIEREEIMFHAGGAPGIAWAYLRRTGYALPGCSWAGSTHLIAAMRCFVASKLGDEVDVPEELTS